jgi:hypothetical protein
LPDPVLHQVLKGSGKAADLLADIVIITDALTSEDKKFTPNDQTQADLEQVLKILVPAAADAASNFDIFAAINTLKHWEDSDGQLAETDVQRTIDVKLSKLLYVSYNIVQKGAFNATTKSLYRYLRESLEAVSKGRRKSANYGASAGAGLVSVFDLKASSADFNLELLKCLLKSIDRSSFAISAAKLDISAYSLWWYKLKYTMRMGRDDLVREQLSEVLNEKVLSMGLQATVYEDSLAELTCDCLCVCDRTCVFSCAQASQRLQEIPKITDNRIRNDLLHKAMMYALERNTGPKRR